MNTENTQLPANITAKFNLALSSFQKIQDKANELVFNEDNLDEIQDFLNNIRKVEKAV